MASLWPGLVAEGCSLSYVWDRGTMERITRSKPDSDIVNSRLIWVIQSDRLIIETFQKGGGTGSCWSSSLFVCLACIKPSNA